MFTALKKKYIGKAKLKWSVKFHCSDCRNENNKNEDIGMQINIPFLIC